MAVFSDGASRWKIKMTFLWAPRDVNELEKTWSEKMDFEIHKMSHEKVCGLPHIAQRWDTFD